MNRHGVPIVAPETRTPRGYATHVELDGALPVVSYVPCELLRAVAIDRLIRPVASLDHLHMARIEMSLAASGPHVATPPGRSGWRCCRTPTAPVATTGTKRQAAIQACGRTDQLAEPTDAKIRTVEERASTDSPPGLLESLGPT